MSETDNCIFCKIIKGEIPSAKIYEDEQAYCFLSIGPVNKGHALVIPKQHYKTLLDLPDSLLGDLFAVVKKVAGAVVKAVDAEGFNLGMNNEKAAGQEVFHAHIHVIPRFLDDGLKHWSERKYEDGEIGELAETIKNNL